MKKMMMMMDVTHLLTMPHAAGKNISPNIGIDQITTNIDSIYHQTFTCRNEGSRETYNVTNKGNR